MVMEKKMVKKNNVNNMNSYFNWRKNDDWENPIEYWEQIVDII